MMKKSRPKVGDEVHVRGDPSVGIGGWDGTVVKVYPHSIEVKDNQGGVDEVSDSQYSSREYEKQQAKDERDFYAEYAKSLNEVVDHSMECKCENNLDEETMFYCTCVVEGLNPEGKVLEKKDMSVETLTVDKGKSMVLDDYGGPKRFKGPFD